jgi:hypothetical protein
MISNSKKNVDLMFEANIVNYFLEVSKERKRDNALNLGIIRLMW